jgi:hypothetical protein
MALQPRIHPSRGLLTSWATVSFTTACHLRRHLRLMKDWRGISGHEGQGARDVTGSERLMQHFAGSESTQGCQCEIEASGVLRREAPISHGCRHDIYCLGRQGVRDILESISVMAVGRFVRVEQPGSHWSDVNKICYLGGFVLKVYRESSIFLKIWQEKRVIYMKVYAHLW